MSGTTIEPDDEVTRRPRAERPQREVHRDDTLTIETTDQISPEQALDQSQRAIQRSEAAAATARRETQEAERRRAEAERARQVSEAGRAQDWQAMLVSTIDGAKAESDAAWARVKAARDVGDADAEGAALTQKNAADFRFNSATADLERLRQQQPAPLPQVQNQGPSVSPAAQRWLDEHPRFKTDREYERYAKGLHNESIEKHQVGSQEYVDYIEREMTAKYGEGHGTAPDGSGPGRSNGAARREEMPERGDTAPPSRGGDNERGGWKSAVTKLGTILYQDKPNGGGRRVRFDSKETDENMRHGAKVNFPEMPAEEAFKLYVEEQLNMRLANYEDEYGSYYKEGDGTVMR